MSLVEYHDPSGLFPVLAPLLQSRLPLKDLHWKSASRPLRSIATLHLEFVPGSGSSKPVSRHQIPGLRQSPYLKVFLLRCDDKETYKTSARNALEDWLKKNNVNLSSSNKAPKQDRHDAFEWLILHVVVPETQANNEPRQNKTISRDFDDSPEKPSTGGSKWGGRGSSTILDKLRKDFNGTSKSAIDRVAQLRLSKDHVPNSMLPALPATPSAADLARAQTNKDQENAWSDLILKFKHLVLASFNLRVLQYEEDIRDREAQRSLPGWNYCTFFLLKEGLARAFESVGLVEDALSGYDELSAGLDGVLHDEVSSMEGAVSKVFSSYSDEIKTLLASNLRGAPSSGESNAELPSSFFDRPLDSSRKDYRALIVASNVSVFDVKCYVVSRRIEILRNITSPGSQRNSIQNGINGTPLSETQALSKGSDTPPIRGAQRCRLANQAIPVLARMLRQELHNCSDAFASASDWMLPTVDLIVNSWTFSAAFQVTAETISPSLPARTNDPQVSPSAKFSFFAANRRNSKGRPSKHASPDLRVNGTGTSQTKIGHANGTQDPASNDLILQLAELYVIQRRTIEKIASFNNWNLVAAAEVDDGEIAEEDDGSEIPALQESQVFKLFRGSQLQSLFNDQSSLITLYHDLTDQAATSYSAVGRLGSSDRLLGDLAMAKLKTHDYSAAATFFGRVAASYADRRWDTMQVAYLKLHARCLKSLNRKDEYARVLLAVLATLRRTSPKPRNLSNPGRSMPLVDRSLERLLQESAELQDDKVFAELVSYSDKLPYDLPAPLADYINDIELDRCVTLLSGAGGFGIKFKIHQHLAEEMSNVRVRMRLAPVGPRAPEREIWLETKERVVLHESTTSVLVETNDTTWGLHQVERIEVIVGKLVFLYEDHSTGQQEPIGLVQRSRFSTSPAMFKTSTIYCYPHADSPRVNLTNSLENHTGQARALDVIIRKGPIAISESQITLRSTTAGLRLRTGEAKILDGVERLAHASEPGIIIVGDIPSKIAYVRITLPFETDKIVRDIGIKVDMSYSTGGQTHTFRDHVSIDTSLLLDVNVQDLFKEKSMFAKFTVHATTTQAIAVLNASLNSADDGARIVSFSNFSDAKTATESDPMLVCFKVSPTRNTNIPLSNDDLPLTLSIRYQTLLEQHYASVIEGIERLLRGSDFQQYRALTEALVRDQVCKRVETMRSDELGQERLSLGQVDWRPILSNIPTDEAGAFEQWLEPKIQDFDESAHALTQDEGPMRWRTLFVDYAIPKVDFFHTASIRPLAVVAGSCFRNGSVALVGMPIAVELIIKHTRKWGKSRVHDAERHTFVCDLDLDSERWLVDGNPRISFDAQDNETKHFNLMLVPLQTGFTAFPSASIDLDRVSKIRSALPEKEELICESECTTQSQGVMVIDGMKSTTFGVGANDLLYDDMTLIESEPG